MDNYREKAIKFVQEAMKADDEQKYEEAFQLYLKSFEWFEMYLKYEKNPASVEKIKQKLNEYIQRAETIKKLIKKTPEGGVSEGGEKSLASTILIEKPSVSWESVIGLETAKETLEQVIILPLRFPDLFVGIKPWKGVLLYGPPGVGKSYIAKAVATQSDRTFFSVSSANLKSKYVGESENLVRSLFVLARERKPSIIFIDEIDSLCASRELDSGSNGLGIKAEFLVQMDGVGNDQSDVLIIGATNLPWILDEAIRSRFEKRIYIPLPDKNARAQMFQANKFLNQKECAELALKTENYSGRDIAGLIRDAEMQPIRKVQTATHFKYISELELTPCSPGDLNAVEMTWKQVKKNEKIIKPPIGMSDFLKSLNQSKSSINLETIERQKSWTEEFGME
jgi:vacuolar protein-sorting-associated protein 4